MDPGSAQIDFAMPAEPVPSDWPSGAAFGQSGRAMHVKRAEAGHNRAELAKISKANRRTGQDRKEKSGTVQLIKGSQLAARNPLCLAEHIWAPKVDARPSHTHTHGHGEIDKLASIYRVSASSCQISGSRSRSDKLLTHPRLGPLLTIVNY